MPYYVPAEEPHVFKTTKPFEDYFVEGFVVHVDKDTGRITGMTNLLHDAPIDTGSYAVETDFMEFSG